MAVLVRASEASSAVTATSHTFTKPTGVLEDDLMLLQLGIGNETQPSVVPDGWELVEQESTAGGTCLNIYAKTATGAEPGDYTFEWTASVTSNGGIIALYSDTDDPLGIDDSEGQSNASSTDRTWPSVTATVVDTMLCCFGLMSSATASTPAGGMSEVWDSSLVMRIYLMTQAIAATGATGTRVATGTATASKCISVLVAEVLPPCSDGATYTYNSVDVSSYCNEIEISWQRDATTRTHLGSTALAAGAAIYRSETRLAGDWHATIDALFGPDAFRGDVRAATAMLNDCSGNVVGYAWAEVFVMSWRVATQANGKIGFEAVIRHSGAAQRSVS